MTLHIPAPLLWMLAGWGVGTALVALFRLLRHLDRTSRGPFPRERKGPRKWWE